MINLFFMNYDFSGVITYGRELMAYMAQCPGVKVHNVSVGENREWTVAEKEGITEISIPRPLVPDFSKEKYHDACARLLRLEYGHLQNIVFHFNSQFIATMVAALRSHVHCRVVYTLHYLEGFYTASRFLPGMKDEVMAKLSPYQKQMLALADRVICVTRFAEEIAHEFYEVPPQKTTTILNGKRLLHTGVATDKEMLKQAFGFDPAQKIILFSGRLEPRKGVELLVQAFREAMSEFPDIRLVIAGAGSYDNYFGYAAGLYGKVHFTGKVEWEDMEKFYRMADIGVIPSRFEQCSYVAIEMMQYALPVVIADVPGLNELFIHETDGLKCRVVPMEAAADKIGPDVADLAGQIKRLLADPAFASRLGRNAFAKAKEVFSVENMGSRTRNVYDEVLQS